MTNEKLKILLKKYKEKCKALDEELVVMSNELENTKAALHMAQLAARANIKRRNNK